MPKVLVLNGPRVIDTLRGLLEERRGRPMLVMLDYDGTLVPLAETPDLAAPDAELVSLLSALAETAAIDLHLVSGRPRDTMERWFGDLPISLWAEHGFWHRPATDELWNATAAVPAAAFRQIRPIFKLIAATTPGSLVEEKSAGLAWHYRRVDGALAEHQANALRTVLTDTLRDTPLEVFDGKKVLEVRVRGANKAQVARRVLAGGRQTPPSLAQQSQSSFRLRAERYGGQVGGQAILAIGDDQTDEELFGALPDSAITVSVGDGQSRARYSLEDSAAVRSLLTTLI